MPKGFSACSLLFAFLFTSSCAALNTPVGLQPLPSLIGTWELLSDDFRRPNGEVIPFPGLGPNVRGLLTYDSTGHMMVHIMGVDRPHFSNLREAPCDDIRASLRAYRGYFGTYQVDAAARQVAHTVIGSPFPALIGQVFTRSFDLQGDQLVLYAPETANGEQGTAVIRWRRLKPL